MWAALRSNEKMVFGHQRRCLVSVGSSFTDHSLLPHGVDVTSVGKCIISCSPKWLPRPNSSPCSSACLQHRGNDSYFQAYRDEVGAQGCTCAPVHPSIRGLPG